MKLTLGNLLLLVVLSTIWAAGYLFVAAADRALPPTTVTAATTLLAALFLLMVVGGVMRRPLWPVLRERPGLVGLIAVLAVAVPQLTIVFAENSIAPDLASLVGTTVPLLTFLITVFVTRQTAYSHVRMAGVAVAVLGLLIFLGLDDLASRRTEIAGILTMMVGGVAFALNGIVASRRAADIDSYVLTTLIMTVAGVGLAVVALAVDGVPDMPSATVWGSLAGSGVLAMGVAYLLYYMLVERAGPTLASLYAFLVPPLGLAFGVVFGGESLTASHVLGLAVTLSGLWLLLRPVHQVEETVGSDSGGGR